MWMITKNGEVWGSAAPYHKVFPFLRNCLQKYGKSKWDAIPVEVREIAPKRRKK